MEQILIKTLIGILTTAIGYILKEIVKVKQELNKRPTMEQLDSYVDLKLEVTKHSQKDIKEDIQRLESKLDRLIDMHLKKKD